MPVSMEFGTEGLDSTRRAMREAKPVVGGAANRALREVGKAYLPVLKSATPRRTGKLAKSSVFQVKGRDFDQRLEVRQGARTQAGGFYGHFVRGGTRAHIIRPVRAKVLRWEGPDGPRFAHQVRHPGTRANPYHQRALEAVRATIEAITQRAGIRVTARLNDIGRGP